MTGARSEADIYGDLEEVCRSPGYIHVLAYFCFRDNFLMYSAEAMTPEDMAKSYGPHRLIRTEIVTLIGMLVKQEISYELPPPSVFQSLIDKTQELLLELHHSLNEPMMACFTPAFVASGQDPFARADVLREPIFYGGESAYSFQYRDFAKERYAADRVWLAKAKGFGIDDAHRFALAVGEIHNRKMLETFRGMAKADPATWTFLPGLTCTKEEVGKASGLSAELLERLIDAFCFPESPSNAQFTALGDFNAAAAYPLIKKTDEEFVCLNLYNLFEALYDSPFYWMVRTEYKDIALKNRGKFTEEFVARRLESVFGDKNVFRNVDLLNSRGDRVTEVDILVTFADRLIVVQCKSKKMTLEARRGNDLQLQDDFKKAVQDAYDQALLASKRIAAGGVELWYQGSKLSLSPAKEIYPLCVVSDHYPALTVQGAHFLKFEVSETINPPLVTDVFFIDVLAEMLNSPLRFLSYVNRRANYREKIHAINELTILGYHLSQNLWFENDLDFVAITDDYGIDLDVAMTVRRDGVPGNPVPKGILSRLAETTVGRILSGIEHAPEPALVDLGFLLLTLSEDTIRTLSGSIDQIAKQTRRDGKRHDVTLGFGDAKAGITVHSNNVADKDAAEALARHCELRKYRQEADTWFGLAVRPEDSMPVIGIQLKKKWQQDPGLDELTKGMSKAPVFEMRGKRFKKAKVGRNSPCPCGSGLKFKKCCGRASP